MQPHSTFTHRKLRGIVCLVLFLLLSAASISAGADTSNKWRLQFSGGANSDGVITMKFTPKEGVPSVAEIPITKGTGENDVAKAVVRGLKAQLPEDQYHVERDDGEDVLVKRKMGGAYFGYELVSNTVAGVKINPDKE